MNVKLFNKLVNALKYFPLDDSFITDLKKITTDMATNGSLQDENAKTIKNIFLAREQTVSNGQYTYTSTSKRAREHNTPWLALAKALCSKSGLFDFHYYLLLFSQVSNIYGFDVVQRIPIIGQPLGDLFLSKNKQLLSLKSGFLCAQANHGIMGFYLDDSRSSDTKRYWYELNAAEEEHLKLTNTNYFDKLIQLRAVDGNNDNGKRLNFVTVQALILLVECSDFKSGSHEHYSEKERSSATVAYNTFINFLTLLSDKEKASLMGQIIHCEGRGILFEYLWMAVTNDQLCVSWASKDIARLILDYKPLHVFRNLTLQEASPTLILRIQNEKKEYSDDCPFEEMLQMLAMAFVVINQLLCNGVESERQNTFLMEELLPFSARIKSKVASKDMQNECMLLIEKSMVMFDDFLTNATVLMNEAQAAECILSHQSKLSGLFSTLTTSNSPRVINRLTREARSFCALNNPLNIISNFFQSMRSNNIKFFTCINKQIAMGLLIIKQLKEIGVNDASLDCSSDNLFLLMGQEVAQLETEKTVNELINLFVTNLNAASLKSSSPDVALKNMRKLSQNFSSLYNAEAEELIKVSCIERLLNVFCQPASRPTLFIPMLTDLDGKEINIASLTQACLVCMNSHPVEKKYFFNQLNDYICSLSDYTFSKPNKENASALVVKYSKELVKSNDSFDL